MPKEESGDSDRGKSRGGHIRSFRLVSGVLERLPKARGRGGGKLMKCPICGEAVTLEAFHLHGYGDTYELKFVCPKCKHEAKDKFPFVSMDEIADVARGMLIC